MCGQVCASVHAVVRGVTVHRSSLLREFGFFRRSSDRQRCRPSSSADVKPYISEDFFIHALMVSKSEIHRVQRKSVTARRRDRIPCIQACDLTEVALRVQFTCCVFLRSELQVQGPAREPLETRSELILPARKMNSNHVNN